MENCRQNVSIVPCLMFSKAMAIVIVFALAIPQK